MTTRIGDVNCFAIESHITKAYHRPGAFALGYFNIYLRGKRFGKTALDSTLLGCSHDEVKRRLSHRGMHRFSFSNEDKCDLVTTYLNSRYWGKCELDVRVINARAFDEEITSNELVWAPDGDQAFDDGSHVLQFDLDSRVRLLGFKNEPPSIFDCRSIVDIIIDSDIFYDILYMWAQAVEVERNALLESEQAE